MREMQQILFVQVFRIVDPSLAVRWSFKDGDAVKAGTRFGTVEGHAYGLIVAERVVLNFMQRMSGIATMTAKMHNEVKARLSLINNCCCPTECDHPSFSFMKAAKTSLCTHLKN